MSRPQHVYLFYFDKTLLSTKGCELVRKYYEKQDAQKLYEDLCNHCLHSTVADNECDQINDFLINASANVWNGSMFDFISCIKEKAKDYNDKSDTPFTEAQVCKLLEHAVSDIPDLKAIKTTAKQTVKANNKHLTLLDYYHLLEEAALDYDIKMGRTTNSIPCTSWRPVKHALYAHDTQVDTYDVQEHDFDVPPLDDDTFYDCEFDPDASIY